MYDKIHYNKKIIIIINKKKKKKNVKNLSVSERFQGKKKRKKKKESHWSDFKCLHLANDKLLSVA